MGISLFDSSVTNDTPGVAWLATTDPIGFSGVLLVARVGFDSSLWVTELLDPSLVVGGGNAYVVWLQLESDGGITLYLSDQMPSVTIGTEAGPQLTDDAESNLGLAIRRSDDGTEYKWRFSDLVASDSDEPYFFSADSVANAGPEVTNTLTIAIRDAGNVQSILIDRNHSRINWDDLETIEPPEAPTVPTLTSPSPTSIRVTLSADPTSDATISSRDVRYRTGMDAWTVDDDVTSPHTITGLSAGTEYEVQWRAASSAGDGDWSPSATIETSYQIGNTQRLETIDDLELIFDRENSGDDAGAWTEDAGASTPSGNTGPGTNSSGPYVFSETSGTTLGEADVIANSVLTVNSDLMTEWTGSARKMELRAAIQGAAWTQTGEGFQIQGRADAGDAWTTIALLRGWPYSNSYDAGDTITDANGDALECAQDGGWVDFEVEIADAYTQVRVRSMPVAGQDVTYQHDIGLWQARLSMRVEPTLAFTTASSKVAGGADVDIEGTVSDDEDDDGSVNVVVSADIGTVSAVSRSGGTWSVTWTAPAETMAEQSATITATATNSANLTATATRVWTVRALPPPLALPRGPRRANPVFAVEVRNRLGQNVLSSFGVQAQAQVWSSIVQGGSHAATVHLAGPTAALDAAHGWLGHEVAIRGRGGQIVWYGYVNEVYTPDGVWQRVASLDGYANALRVEYYVLSGGNREQRVATVSKGGVGEARYGLFERGVSIDNDLAGVSSSERSAILDEVANNVRSATWASGPLSGAMLQCVGYARLFDRRYAPRYVAGHYGDHAAGGDSPDFDGLGESVSANDPGEASQYADLSIDGATQGDEPLLLSQYPHYMSRMRWRLRRTRTDTSLDLTLSIRQADADLRPTGGDISGHQWTVGGRAITTSGDGETVDIDWAGEVSPLTLLPSSGFVFRWHRTAEGASAMQVESGRRYWNDSTTRAWKRRLVGNQSWQAVSPHFQFDFFTRAPAWALADALISATPVSLDARSRLGAVLNTFPVYWEGTSQLRPYMDEVAQLDRLGYAVGPGKRLRLYPIASAPDEDQLRLRPGGMPEGVAAGDVDALVGRWVDGGLCVGASYDMAAGVYDLSYSGRASAQVISERIGRARLT